MAEKEEYSPSAAGVAIAAVICILIGLSGAVINLSAKAVTEVPELPKEEEIDSTAIYFVKGKESRGSGWKSKRATFSQGRKGAVSLSEGELNVWARTSFKINPKTKEQPTSSLLGVEIIPSPPNFKVEKDSLQIASNLQIPLIGSSKNFVYQVRGSFENIEGVQVFVPSKSSIGSCPIPSLFGISNFTFNFLAGGFYGHDEFSALNASWTKLGSIEMKDQELTLVIP